MHLHKPTISHSLNKHPRGQARGRCWDSDTDAVPFPRGDCLPSVSRGLSAVDGRMQRRSSQQAGEEPPSRETQRQPESVQGSRQVSGEGWGSPGWRGGTHRARGGANTEPPHVCKRWAAVRDDGERGKRRASEPGARSGRACWATVCVHVSWKMLLPRDYTVLEKWTLAGKHEARLLTSCSL